MYLLNSVTSKLQNYWVFHVLGRHVHLSECPARPSWCRSGSSPACSCWSCQMTWCVPKETRKSRETPCHFISPLQRRAVFKNIIINQDLWQQQVHGSKAEQLDSSTAFNVIVPQLTRGGLRRKRQHSSTYKHRINCFAILTGSHSKHILNTQDQGKLLIKKHKKINRQQPDLYRYLWRVFTSLLLKGFSKKNTKDTTHCSHCVNCTVLLFKCSMVSSFRIRTLLALA